MSYLKRLEKAIFFAIMPQTFRPLLPSEPGPSTENYQLPTQPNTPKPSTGKRPLINAACQSCQRKKTKCDGGRPVCAGCKPKKQQCVYDTEPGQTRFAALRAKNDQLKSDLSVTLEVIWWLRTAQAEDAQLFVARLRSTVDIPSVLHSINIRGGSEDRLEELRGQILGLTASDYATGRKGRSELPLVDGATRPDSCIPLEPHGAEQANSDGWMDHDERPNGSDFQLGHRERHLELDGE